MCVRKLWAPMCCALGALLAIALPTAAQSVSDSIQQPAQMAYRLTPLREARALAPGLRRMVGLSLIDVALPNAIQAIERESGLSVLYSTDDLPRGKRVTLRAERVEVADALTRVVEGTDVGVFVALNGQVVLAKLPAPLRAAAAPVGTIVGRVTDAKTQAALPGATVVVQGTSHSATTGSDGRYRIAAVAPGTYTVRARYVGYSPGAVSATVNADQETTADIALESAPTNLSEVVVTGTYVRHADPIGPLITLSHDDLVAQGYTRLSQAIEQLPQNFTAGASENSNPVNAAGNGSSNNYGYASGVNLRGLGAGATLVLLNGRRLAPTAYGDVTDLSQIPVSIIDRVEILTDGASALYGSDAVAGVVNIITRRDYSGFEVGARATGISRGKSPNWGGNLLGGFSWKSGSAILNFDHDKANPLFARERPFAGTLPDPWILSPDEEASHYYGSVQQQLSDRLSLTADGLVTQRKYFSQNRFHPADVAAYSATGDVHQYNTALQFDYKVSPGWTATLVGQASKEPDLSTLMYPTEDLTGQDAFDYRVLALEPRMEGALFNAPGGAVRLALGTQLRHERFEDNTSLGPLSGPLTAQPPAASSRYIASAFGELLLPIIGGEHAMPFARSLRIDVSGRYDHYTGFGHTFNPKFGLDWMPAAGLTLHTTYARSFQAPTPYEVSTAFRAAYVLPVPDPKASSGSTLALVLDGTNPNLQPETARSVNVGLVYEPRFARGLKLDASYYSLDFDNQINRLTLLGFLTNVLQQEAVLGSFVQRNPSDAQINQALNAAGRTIYNFAGGNFAPGPYAPTDIKAIADLGYVNAASVRVRGIDFTVHYGSAPMSFGRIHADFGGTYFSGYRQRITPTASDTTPLNTVYNPLRFRAKASFGWDHAGWALSARLNYSNAYDNSLDPNCSSTNSCRIDAWFTVDPSVSYTTPARALSLLRGVRISVDAMNVFNRRPPLVTQPDIFHYDPTNANPFLRMVAITVTKAWDPWR